MEIKEQPKLIFSGIDILKLNFNAKNPSEKDFKTDIKCTPRVFYPKNKANAFHIIMDVEVESENFFAIQLSAIGNFQLSEELTEELKIKFVNSNAPAIMFPYIRAFISMLTSNLGRAASTVTIPTYFFKGDLEEYRADGGANILPPGDLNMAEA
jgi:preprotein translocase subunit SecB